MCLKNGRKPREDEKVIVGYCFQKKVVDNVEKDKVYYRGVYHSCRYHKLGCRYKMVDALGSDRRWRGEPADAEIGFYGYVKLKDAEAFERLYLDDAGDFELVLMKAKFYEVFDVGRANTFDCEGEKGVKAVRAKYRTLLKEVKTVEVDDGQMG